MLFPFLFKCNLFIPKQLSLAMNLLSDFTLFIFPDEKRRDCYFRMSRFFLYLIVSTSLVKSLQQSAL